MSFVRACMPCRNAKAKVKQLGSKVERSSSVQADHGGQCDRVRPVCGRCAQRAVSCSGFPADVGFIFRDENEASQRNSERARRRPRDDRVLTVPIDVTPSGLGWGQQTQAFTDARNPHLQLQYLWLNERSLSDVKGPLKRDPETRAVDRFFVNWTLYPLNKGASTGYMHDLPALYFSAPPKSALWQAVRAVAFADMNRANTGRNDFQTMARQCYGATLSRIRAAAQEEQELANDHVLAAILLIDNFEVG